MREYRPFETGDNAKQDFSGTRLSPSLPVGEGERGAVVAAMEQDRENRDASQIGEARPDRRLESGEDHRAYHGVNLLEERDRQRQQLGRELQELDREIEVSDGYRLRNRMSLLERSYFVFDTNYLNLKHILNEFEQPMVFLKLWEEKTRSRFDLFINDVIRLFHNYLAGGNTLLDHIRTLHGATARETGFSDEYQERWNEQFGERSLPNFLEDLLSYLLNEGLPFALAELNFGKVGVGMEVSSSIRLDARRLGEWERWSEKGREHLNSLDYKAKFEDLINEHAATVADFYQWFVVRQSELHQKAYGELKELESKREDLVRKIENLEDFLESAERITITVREEREDLLKELEAERQYRESERMRVEGLEATLEQERNKGFWSRAFGRQ